MQTRFLVLSLLLLTCGSHLAADSPAPPYSHITTSHLGNRYFLMVPKSGEGARYDDGWGVAYELMADGTPKELWRTDGWYAFKVFLSSDGRYLVRMGPWNFGHEPSPQDLALAFYDNGKLLRQYSTAHLVKDKTKVRASVSHYRWLDDDRTDPDMFTLDWSNKFHLKTADGIVYVFDITTGKVVEQRKDNPAK